MALLLERNRTSLHVLEMARAFHLTQREREAVEYLAQGLTSKEIAERMRISANTVKAFLRLVMIKTGTSTRSGIVGKFIRESSLDSKAGALPGCATPRHEVGYSFDKALPTSGFSLGSLEPIQFGL